MKKYKDKEGYIQIEVKNHPKAYKGFVSEHILVMESYLGRYLPDGSVVHHRNKKKSDNRIENLLLMRSSDDHLALHRAMDKGDSIIVQAIEFWCFEYIAELKYEQTNNSILIDQNTEEKNSSVQEDIEPMFWVRRNIQTGKPFINFEDEVLISPEGKVVEVDDTRFSDVEDVPSSELTDLQLKIFNNMNSQRDDEYEIELSDASNREKLFQALRMERNKMARELGFSPFVVCYNSTLLEMVESLPTTDQEMLKINGIGPVKLEKYGRRFLKIIIKYVEDFGLAS